MGKKTPVKLGINLGQYPSHPPGQDLVQVGVQSGARKLQPLLWHQAGAAGAEHAGARHHVQRERAGGLAAGQPRPELADGSLLWYLHSHSDTME